MTKKKETMSVEFEDDVEMVGVPEAVDTGLVPIFVPGSPSVEQRQRKLEDGSMQKYVYGFVNGEYFEVPCNQQAMVKPEVAGALEGMLRHLAK